MQYFLYEKYDFFTPPYFYILVMDMSKTSCDLFSIVFLEKSSFLDLY